MSKIIIPDFVQGDSIKLTFNTSPSKSLLGATFKITLKKNDSSSIKYLYKTYTASTANEEDNPGLGVVTFYLSSEDTNIPEGSYIVELVIELNGRSSALRSGKDNIPNVKCFKSLSKN